MDDFASASFLDDLMDTSSLLLFSFWCCRMTVVVVTSLRRDLYMKRSCISFFPLWVILVHNVFVFNIHTLCVVCLGNIFTTPITRSTKLGGCVFEPYLLMYQSSRHNNID
jgi:hypothetical protein